MVSTRGQRKLLSLKKELVKKKAKSSYATRSKSKAPIEQEILQKNAIYEKYYDCLRQMCLEARYTFRYAKLPRMFNARFWTNAELINRILVRAIKERELVMISYLLERGLRVTIAPTDPSGTTALHLAVTSGFAFLADELLDHVDGTNYRDPEGLTHFHVACMTGHRRAVDAFLARGCDANLLGRLNGEPATPLLLAVHFRHYELAKLLLERGADPRIRGERASVLHLLQPVTDNWMLGPRLCYPDQLEAFKSPQGLDLLTMLLKRGADVDARNSHGHTLLQMAVSALRDDVVELLLERGARCQDVEFEGGCFSAEFRCPRYLEVVQSCLRIVKLLTEYGYEMNPRRSLKMMEFLIGPERYIKESRYFIEEAAVGLNGHILDLGSHTAIRNFFDTIPEGPLNPVDDVIRIETLAGIHYHSEKSTRGGFYLERETKAYLATRYAQLALHSYPTLTVLVQSDYWREMLARVSFEIELAKLLTLKSRHSGDDTGWSLHDLCVSSPSDTWPLLTKVDYESVLNDPLFDKKFPSIGGRIKGFVAKALVRKTCETYALGPIMNLMKFRLPELCCKNVIKYLDNEDLLRVSKAV
ncbi:uncharacterized protein LOC106652350 [Trichogramma pretiosum]|uniref:uncharacterized protein LOC106652350 n=1 Tax=Trichogramma pretiosum TaxID=7493 RepID=UPI0006C984FC|nr:uncharacterized protein LOC106652350 [Trichogramma pretiosum]